MNYMGPVERDPLPGVYDAQELQYCEDHMDVCLHTEYQIGEPVAYGISTEGFAMVDQVL